MAICRGTTRRSAAPTDDHLTINHSDNRTVWFDVATGEASHPAGGHPFGGDP
jgi:hypothetical protein